MNKCLCAAALATLAFPAVGQDGSALAVQTVCAAPAAAVVLSAGTEIPFKVSQLVTIKGKGWEEGDQFGLIVATDGLLSDFVVIPAGTPGKGRITWLTSRGAFGKSGKMDIELEIPRAQRSADQPRRHLPAGG